MPNSSPDVSTFVDLRLYDKDVQDIFEVAKQHIESRLPDVTLREDNTETILLESFSLMIAETAMAINRVPASIMTALLKMYGSEFYEGKAPVYTLRFTPVDSFPYELAIGTRVALPISDEEYLILTTTTTGVMNDSDAIVTATTTTKTAAGNFVPVGTELDLLDQIMFVSEVKLESVAIPGEDPEDDVTWLNRSVQRLNRLTDTLVTAKHFQTAALEEVGVYRAQAIDNFNGSTSTGGVPGHITVAVYGPSGALTTQRKNEIKTSLAARSMSTLTVHVVDPLITSVNITATIITTAGYDKVAVKNAVDATLRAKLSPQVWDWRGTLNRNEIIAIIGSVEGVSYVDSLTTPSANVTLSGAAPLVNVGTINLTVN